VELFAARLSSVQSSVGGRNKPLRRPWPCEECRTRRAGHPDDRQRLRSGWLQLRNEVHFDRSHPPRGRDAGYRVAQASGCRRALSPRAEKTIAGCLEVRHAGWQDRGDEPALKSRAPVSTGWWFASRRLARAIDPLAPRAEQRQKVVSDLQIVSAPVERRDRGVFSGAEEAVEACVKVRDLVQPNPDWRETYEHGYARFRALDPALRPLEQT